MKIYTKTGDDGMSSLINSERIKKSDIIFDVLGTVDELSSHIGLAKAADGGKVFFSMLEEVQKTLAKLMAGVASGGDKKYEITEENILFLEKNIDCLEKSFAFVLPGKNELSARLDVARCVARRAERLFVRAGEKYTLDKNAGIYLNRLSDFLYTLALAERE